MYIFVSGMCLMASWVVALFFYRFWKKTNDRFFWIFSLAFFALGVERAIPFLFKISDENRHYIYLIRLLAFGLIAFAIIGQNRDSGQREG